jgi:TP901 family phage tail tape measure protein
MALSNQATITLAVNVQNLASLRALTAGLMSLRTTLLGMQRNTAMRTAFGPTPAQVSTMKTATTAAGALATNTQKVATAQRAAAVASSAQRAGLRGMMGTISDAEHKFDALWRAAFRLSMLGNDLKRFGQAIIGGLQGALDAFGDFEFMVNRAAGAMEIWGDASDTTRVNSEQLQNAILETSKELRLFPAADVAKAVYFWGSTTGVVVETQEQLRDVMQSIIPIMKTAAMTEVDYETAIKGVYGILVQFYPLMVNTANATQDYSEMNRVAGTVMEQLFYITQKTAAEFTDLVQSFKMVGPVAGSLGVSFEDMVILIGRLADAGLRGTMAGRSFRQLFIQLVRPSGPAIAAIEAVIEKLDAGTEAARIFSQGWQEAMFPKGEFVGMDRYIHNLTMMVKDLTTADRAHLLGRIATANMLPTLIALVQQHTDALDENVDVTAKTKDMWKEANDYFRQAWDLLANSWKGTVGAMERTFESIVITVGRGLADSFSPFVIEVTKILDKIDLWVKANPELVKQLGMVAGAMGTVLVVAGSLFVALGTGIAVFAGFSMALPILAALISKFTVFGSVVGSVIDSVARNWDVVVSRLQQAAENIQQALSNISEHFGGTEGAAQSLGDAFRILGDFIVEHVTNAIVVISQLVLEISKFKPLFEFIKNVGIPVVTSFLGMFVAGKYWRSPREY